MAGGGGAAGADGAAYRTVAVFIDGWTIEAAAQVAGLGEDRALELLEALARGRGQRNPEMLK